MYGRQLSENSKERHMNAINLLTEKTARSESLLKENATMLIHEDLAKIRISEVHRAAQQERLARLTLAAKRWDRIAGWAAKRALQASRRLP